MKIATASDLKFAVETSGNEPYFFTRDSMKFFGDRMANYGVRQPREIVTQSGETVRAYELARRRPVKHGLQSSAWFHAETFARVFPADYLILSPGDLIEKGDEFFGHGGWTKTISEPGSEVPLAGVGLYRRPFASR